MRFRYRLEFIFLTVFVRLALRIRGGFRRCLAVFLGWFAFDVLRIRRAVTLSNMRLVFENSISNREIVSLGRKTYISLATRAFELCDLTVMTRDEIVQRCEVEHRDRLENALARGNGAILAAGHIGNWELLAASIPARGIPLSAVAARMKNPFVDCWISEVRSGYGLNLIGRGRYSARHILRALGKNHCVLLLIDQDARKYGAFVPFFGQLVSTRTGAATLAQRARCPIIPVTIRPEKDAIHTVTFHTAIEPPERGAQEEAIIDTLQSIHTEFERCIRADPSLWFWPHRRFKTKPPVQERNE